jgi:CTP synthase (UTP-ammonia lyase)
VISKLTCSLAGKSELVRIMPGTLTRQAYGREETIEEFRCNYGLNPAYREQFGAGALKVSGIDLGGEFRIVELPDHCYFVATLFLPQLSSSPDVPHPLILAYLKAAVTQETTHVNI